MSENPLVSIIIPCRKIDDYTRECVRHCKQLSYGNFEIILLPDDASENMEGIKVVSTGLITPGAKRNIGISMSSGEICAFIDSDAYPRNDWLRNAVKYLADPQVAAVGGPGITPEEDGFMQKSSGFVLSSFMVGGLSNRYRTKISYESYDIHSCNFMARKRVLNDVGGWNEKYWPGEDTLICLAMQRQGLKLIEASDVVVYHHRRSLYTPHLKQVSRFGVHRGFFVKRFRGNSVKLTFFMPSFLLLAFIVTALMSIGISFFSNVLLMVMSLYLVVSLISTLSQVKNLKMILVVWSGSIMTHLAYGTSFLVGLLKRDLKR